MKQVIDREGNDITGMLVDAATAALVDPVHLVALLQAESALYRKAERYGMRTNEFLQHLMWYQHGDHSQEAALQNILYDVWPDVSFSYGQQIVLFHYYGDRTSELQNVLTVRDMVFQNPYTNIADAAMRFASGIERSLDGTPLGGMVVYNAGSDKRNDPAWMSQYGGNVVAYERALAWAEQYRDDVAPPTPDVVEHLDQLWGVANELEQARHEDLASRIKERVVAIKNLLG